jgi:hypothetical protein
MRNEPVWEGRGVAEANRCLHGCRFYAIIRPLAANVNRQTT